MKQSNSFKTIFFIVMAVLLTSLAPSSWAIGPRITKSLLSPNANQIYTYDFSPFSTTDLATGGFNVEVVGAILKISNIDASQTIDPIQSMLKFHLKQGKALAIYGQHLNFSKKEKNNLIYIPISISSENYIYYKPAHKSGLNWNGKLNSLKGLIYGANKGQNVIKFKNAGIHVEYGRTHSLLKKLSSKKIDFISMSDLNRAWMLSKHFPVGENNFSVIKQSGIKNPTFIIFNKKHLQGRKIAKNFKKGLFDIVRNGTYLNIVKKYIKEKPDRMQYMIRIHKLIEQYK